MMMRTRREGELLSLKMQCMSIIRLSSMDLIKIWIKIDPLVYGANHFHGKKHPNSVMKDLPNIKMYIG